MQFDLGWLRVLRDIEDQNAIHRIAGINVFQERSCFIDAKVERGFRVSVEPLSARQAFVELVWERSGRVREL